MAPRAAAPSTVALAATCPSGWTCTDIGNPSPPGVVSLQGTILTITAGGSDIWNTADHFTFTWQHLSGDGTVSARILSQSATSPYAKAGVMYRADTNAGAPFYAVFATPAHGIMVEYRLTANGQAYDAQIVPGTVPIYVQALRLGNQFSAAISTDGTQWTTLAGAGKSIAMGATALAGLAVTSHANYTAGTVTASLSVASLGASTATPSVASTVPASRTMTGTPSATVTSTGTTTSSPTQTPLPSATATATGTATPSYTSTPTPSRTDTATATSTATPTGTATPSPSATATGIATGTAFSTPIATASATPTGTQAATLPPMITSVDTMKESRDTETRPLTDAQIADDVNLAATLHANYITVDTHWDYPDYMQRWVTAIRTTGRHVWFRIHPNQWGDNNGTTGIMTPAAYLASEQAFISAYPALFQPGDILDPCPEPENGLYWIATYGSGWTANAPNAATEAYNAFIRDSTDVADAALHAAGIYGVITTVRSTNSFFATHPGVLEVTTVAKLGHVTFDSYPEGTTTDPTTAANARVNEIKAVAQAWPGVPIILGEMGYSDKVAVDDSTQEAVLSAEFSAIAPLTYVAGINYWVGAGTDNSGGYTHIFSGSTGAWTLRPAAADLSAFFAQELLSHPQ